MILTLKQMDFILREIIGVSDETLNFATGIYGYNKETLENVLYYFTGYKDFNQMDEGNPHIDFSEYSE